MTEQDTTNVTVASGAVGAQQDVTVANEQDAPEADIVDELTLDQLNQFEAVIDDDELPDDPGEELSDEVDIRGHSRPADAPAAPEVLA